MKNWLKNLLFVIFSFVFLGVGMLIANILINQKGNPLKDPNFLADISSESVDTSDSLSVDSTDGWLGNTVQIPEPIVEVPKLEGNQELKNSENRKNLDDYDVIVGMFGERSNANKQIKRLKEIGFDHAYICPKLSMSIVSAGKFDKSKAKKIASDLNAKGFDVIVRRSVL